MSYLKVDTWALGVILAELVLNKQLWSSLKLSQRIRKVISLVQSNTSVLERIAREHNCFELYQVCLIHFSLIIFNCIFPLLQDLDKDLKDLIENCLQIFPKHRQTPKQLLQKEMFKDFKLQGKTNKSKICPPFEVFTINELYHWWQLAGGDVLVELKKQGLIRSSPPILSLPK